MNIAQIKAIEAKNKQRILELCPNLRDVSAIYILTREENGFKYAYIGQAKHALTRLASHLNGYNQHIDLSLKKHGLYSPTNPTGWNLKVRYIDESKLDEKERELICLYAGMGYQLRNKTGGGQDGGKFGIDDNKPSKGYRDGLVQGYKNAVKELKHIVDLHLNVTTKSSKPNKVQEKALNKFFDILNGGNDNEV